MAGLARQFERSRRSPRESGRDRAAVEHIADGHVFVAQREGVIVGFAAVLTRPDGNAELVSTAPVERKPHAA